MQAIQVDNSQGNSTEDSSVNDIELLGLIAFVEVRQGDDGVPPPINMGRNDSRLRHHWLDLGNKVVVGGKVGASWPSGGGALLLGRVL